MNRIARSACPDIRSLGFADRTKLSEAQAWIDAHANVLAAETIEVEGATGRITAGSFVSPVDWPDADYAAIDGYAVRAAESEGSSDYNPIPLALVIGQAHSLPPGHASIAAAGTPLPSGADAVLSFDAAEPTGPATLNVLSPVARGMGVIRRADELRAGMEAVPGSTRLRPQDVALLVATGVEHVAVVRHPCVRLVVAGPKTNGRDALTPMLCALLARDGGIVEVSRPIDGGRTALAQAMARPGGETDLVLVAGRSGAGRDDEAPLAIVAAGGRLDLHGIAMRPGELAGLGAFGGLPVLLLPGAPLACLASYDMLAARAVRRMAGLGGTGSYAVVGAVLDRKIVSAIGSTDLVRVTMTGGRATPLGSAEYRGLCRRRARGWLRHRARDERRPCPRRDRTRSPLRSARGPVNEPSALLGRDPECRAPGPVSRRRHPRRSRGAISTPSPS